MSNIGKALWAKGFGRLGRIYCEHDWLREVVPQLPNVGPAIDRTMRKSACRYDLLTHLANGEDSLARLAEIDQQIMRSVRGMLHPSLTATDRKNCYHNVLTGATTRERFLLETALELINISSVVPQYPDPAIDVAISDDAKRIVYTTDEVTLAVDNAALMWDCNCRDPYPAGYKRRKCPVHSQPGADAITHAFRDGLVRITYDGVSVLWRQVDDLWPPSIDTVHMVRHLADDGYLSIPARHICDLGCGTGFLGIWACTKNRTHRHVSFADWLVAPLLLAHGNFCHRPAGVQATGHYRLGLHDDWVNGAATADLRKADALLCNPPYLPG